MRLCYVLVLLLSAFMISGCAIDADLSSLLSVKEAQVFEDFKLQKVPFIKRSVQQYEVMTIGSDGVAYVIGAKDGLPVIRAFDADGQPRTSFGENGVLVLYPFLKISMVDQLAEAHLVPIQKNGHEEILVVYNVRGMPAISSLRFIHINTSGVVTYTSSVELPADRVIYASYLSVKGENVYLGYSSTFTEYGSGTANRVAFFKSNVYGVPDQGFGTNGLLSLDGTLSLGEFVITSTDAIAMVGPSASSMSCYLIQGSTTPSAYVFYNTYNGIGKIVLKNNYIYVVNGTHKLFRLSEDCQTTLGPVDLAISTSSLIDIADTGSTTIVGTSINYSTKAITRFEISANLSFTKTAMGVLPLEINHSSATNYYMAINSNKVYFLGDNSKDTAAVGSLYDPVLNIFDLSTWNSVGSYFFNENTTEDLTVYLSVVRQTGGELFALGQYEHNRTGYRGLLMKMSTTGLADTAFAAAGYWMSADYLVRDIIKLSTGEYLLLVNRNSDNKNGFLKIDLQGNIVTSFAVSGFYQLPNGYTFNYQTAPPFEANGILYITGVLSGSTGKVFLLNVATGAASIVDTKMPFSMKRLNNGSTEIRDIRLVSTGVYEVRRLVYDGSSTSVLETVSVNMSGTMIGAFFSDDQYSFVNMTVDSSDAANYKLDISFDQFTNVGAAVVNATKALHEEHIGGIGSYYLQVGESTFGYAIAVENSQVVSKIYRFKKGQWSAVNVEGSLISTYALMSETEVYTLNYSVVGSELSRQLRKVNFPDQ